MSYWAGAGLTYVITLMSIIFIYIRLGRPRNLGGFGYGGWGWGWGAGIALGFIASVAVLSLFFW
nr:hypothetical protein [Neobacillus drentensis]